MSVIPIVKAADNLELAEIAYAVEKAWGKTATPGQAKILKHMQSLINRIHEDDKKIRKLEKMNGITWLGDKEEEGEGEKGELIPRTADTLYKDRDAWPIPINVAGGGFVQQAYWQGREDGAREMEKEIYGK